MNQLFFLAFESGEFFQDIIIPGLIGAVVFALILNSLAKKFGYFLF